MKRKHKYFNVILSILIIAIFAFGGVLKAEALSDDENTKVIYELKDWTKLTDNVYVSTGEYLKVNMVLVVYNNKGTLIDLGYNEAEGKRIKEFMDNNNIKLENIIITHLHGDHIGNDSTFEPLVSGDKVYTPYSTTDGQIIEMENEKFKIVKTAGHADNVHDSIELVNEHFLVSGDVIVTNWIPVLQFGGSYYELKDSLEKIRDENYDLIIPGHGDIIEASLAVDNQLEYITNVYDAVQKISASTERPVSEGELKNKLYGSIKVEECVKDMSVLDKEGQEDFHKGNIDKILNAVVMDAFISGEIQTPDKYISVNKDDIEFSGDCIYFSIEDLKDINGKYNKEGYNVQIDVNDKKINCRVNSKHVTIDGENVKLDNKAIIVKSKKDYISIELLDQLNVKVIIK